MLNYRQPVKNLPQGFTIIEVLVSLLIVSMVATSILLIFPLTLRIGKNSEMNSVATTLAQGRIEEISLQDYDDIPIGTIENKVRISGSPQSPFYSYYRTTTISYADGNLNDTATDQGLKKVTVTIFWKSTITLPTEKSLTIRGLIAKK
jgi:prepilin-type N-terminal cleavage/methylation domain-containing protein